ncbi:prepilin-type N-terminal cleavage/methylation domain-containing protein [Xylophilus sp. Leaf220]|uniref:prepilin-type N-terminal cleavage/methylation domain-containing protein n=1 Tax=Xylophilus sp. Leaf220 TaxID=1735686 RepID=UPI0006F5A27D|nr:secretion system protein [Xylophilus sp. Leaf220]
MSAHPTPRRVGRAARPGTFTRIQRGFTLVEMAIVLAVIGLIIGAIAIGKDVQRNAEYTKIKNKFIDQWEQAYNAYYQRAGVVLGDSQTAPRLMVNGANYAVAAGASISGGNMTAVAAPNAICHGAAGPAMTRAVQGGAAGAANAFDLRLLMNQAGVRMPPGRAEGSEDRYVYLDTNGNPQEIQVCFQWNAPGTAANSGNVMVITGLTPDLARMLDQMVDGKPDAQEGRFRQQGVANGVANTAGVEWAANNTFEDGAAAPGANVAGRTQDEDQVIRLVAIYKMNQ